MGYYQYNRRTKTKKSLPKKLFIILLIPLGILTAYITLNKLSTMDNNDEIYQKSTEEAAEDEKFDVNTAKFKKFSPKQFSELYSRFAYPNTRLIINDYSITGDEKADKVINNLAESAGYQVRTAPVKNSLKQIDKGIFLQSKAEEAWTELQKQAKKAKLSLRVTEGFRSAEDQSAIFKSRLGKLNTLRIIKRLEDKKIKEILKQTAPPGYSRHHSGYTIDLACENQPEVQFKTSKCFKWLSADNYLNAKKAGWIPSYPEGVKNQGPEPEAWEYVWVGVASLIEK